MSEKKIGFVKWFDNRKGYGFISMDENDDIFVHFSNVEMDGFKKMNIGDQVEFEIRESDKGKGPEALHVKVIAKDRRY